jgi:hypothetical protein
MLVFDIEHGELDNWPVQMNEHRPNPRTMCVELNRVVSATANSPNPLLQFMRHLETVDRDVQLLCPEKVREQCATTRLALTGEVRRV